MSDALWLPEALADVERLYTFLFDKNPTAAAKAAQAILDGANALVAAPRAGRPMADDTERREWFIAFGAGTYVIRYRLNASDIPVIIRVWHSREDRSKQGPPL